MVKRRRTDETEPRTEQDVKTVLFVCGEKPLKKTLVMQKRPIGLTKEQANAMLGEALPPLPQGHFEAIVSTNTCQVFLFRYDRARGCSNTASHQHWNLPHPEVKHKLWEAVTVEPKVHVGFRYMFGHEQSYNISNGTVTIEKSVLPHCPFGETERSRTTDMLFDLRAQVGDEFEVKLLEWECSHHCPFKGGGDLKIAKVGQSTSTAGTILFSDPGALSSASQPDPSSLAAQPDRGSSLSPPPLVITDNITPPKKGEHRYGNVENKSCTENAVRVQLQANMMLLAATALKNLIIKLGEKAGEEINVITCYGISFGGSYPIRVLKLTVDFEDQRCTYEEQLLLYPCVAYPAFIDIGISYILKRLTLKLS